jgi:FkbM family methyltransferase
LASEPFAAQQFLLRNCRCRTIFDVGAYRGEVAAQYAQLFPESDIWAFEPFPESYENLCTRFRGNPRVRLVNAAVTSESGEATFYSNERPATNSLLARPGSGRRYYDAQATTRERITVPTVTIDDYRAQHQIAAPDILKLDIQGNELAALKGADATLREGATQIIYTEVTFVPHYEGGVLFHQLTSHLSERGYSLFGIYDLKWAAIGQLRYGDALYVGDSLRKTVIDRLPDE